MAQRYFEKPNDPEQPQSGVYRWYTEIKGDVITLYVGNAGGRKTKIPSELKGTLFRGVSQAQRNTFSQDKGNKLDTDFIIGTVIEYFIKKNYDCHWEHIDDNPENEIKHCTKRHPMIQDSKGQILKDLRCKNTVNKWQLKGEEVFYNAEREVFKVLEQMTKNLRI